LGTNKKLVFVFNNVLNGTVQAQEFLDIVMMAAAFDLKVSLVFIGDGAYALLKDQNTQQINSKNTLPIMQALSIYDINDIFVDENSLQERSIPLERLIAQASSITRKKAQLEMTSADHVFSF